MNARESFKRWLRIAEPVNDNGLTEREVLELELLSYDIELSFANARAARATLLRKGMIEQRWVLTETGKEALNNAQK